MSWLVFQHVSSHRLRPSAPSWTHREDLSAGPAHKWKCQSVQRCCLQAKSEFSHWLANIFVPLQILLISTDRSVKAVCAFRGTNSELWKNLGASQKQNVAWYCMHCCGAWSWRIETKISSQTHPSIYQSLVQNIEIKMGFAKTRFEHLESQPQPWNKMLWTSKFKCVYFDSFVKEQCNLQCGGRNIIPKTMHIVVSRSVLDLTRHSGVNLSQVCILGMTSGWLRWWIWLPVIRIWPSSSSSWCAKLQPFWCSRLPPFWCPSLQSVWWPILPGPW